MDHPERLAPCGAHEKDSAVGAIAVEAMLYEVSATPKPGLVDRRNCGAHHDMDFFTFMSSAAALRGAFDDFARIGAEGAALPIRSLLPALQRRGQQAEQEMFSMTQGVNTHKGMIFSLGMLTGAAGWAMAQNLSMTAKKLCALTAELCQGQVAAAYAHLEQKSPETLTKGERMYLRYGVTGVRGEVEGGFPAVRGAALPAYRELMQKHLPINDVLTGTLLALLAVNDDTNILGRHDMGILRYVQHAAQTAIAKGGVATEEGKAALLALDDDFIAKWISPGGSADLVAVTHFLYAAEQIHK